MKSIPTNSNVQMKLEYKLAIKAALHQNITLIRKREKRTALKISHITRSATTILQLCCNNKIK
jgi:hypothetical protein